ncbi:MAG: phosphotriesterase [Chloroflexi bacterium]|nr:phosphotriesterase [Chloroflexota bacterium]
MPKVNTVLGSVSADELGVTLIHEHLALGYLGWECDAMAPPYDRETAATTCVEALKEANAYGLKTLVDATASDIGRDIELQKIVSERLGINIVCATGMYTERYGKPGYLKFRSQVYDITAEVYETYVKEITQGIGNTGVKAGVIKVATGHGKITSYEEKILKAAARAQKETGVPIISHTEAGTMGPEQADLLISEGADPRRIAIGHMCGNANLQYHLSVLEKGVYIAFDRLGIDMLFPDKLRKACLMGLLGIGYADKILLSQDYWPYWLGRPFELPELAKPLLANWSYVHVFKNIIPALKEAGVTDDKVNTMMVDNPRRLFGEE